MPSCTKCHQSVLVVESGLCGPCDRRTKAIAMAIKFSKTAITPKDYMREPIKRPSGKARCTDCTYELPLSNFDLVGGQRRDVCRACKSIADERYRAQKRSEAKARALKSVVVTEVIVRPLPTSPVVNPCFVIMSGKFACEMCNITKKPKKFRANGQGQRLSWCMACCERRANSADAQREKKRKGVPSTKPKQRQVFKAPSTPDEGKKYAIVRSDVKYNGLSYLSRNLTLELMGFSNYSDYLGSKRWAKIRKGVFAQKGTKCSLCPAKADQVHHNRYHLEDLLGRNLEHLHPICDDCHEHIEFGPGKVKRHLHEVRAVFCGMLEMNTKSIT